MYLLTIIHDKPILSHIHRVMTYIIWSKRMGYDWINIIIKITD